MSAARLAKLARLERTLDKLHAPPPADAGPAISFVRIIRDPGRPLKSAHAYAIDSPEDFGSWERGQNEPECAFIARVRREIEARAGSSAVLCLLRHRSAYDDPLPPEEAPPKRPTLPEPAPLPAIAAEPVPAKPEPELEPAPPEPPSRFAVCGNFDRSMSAAFERIFASGHIPNRRE